VQGKSRRQSVLASLEHVGGQKHALSYISDTRQESAFASVNHKHKSRSTARIAIQPAPQSRVSREVYDAQCLAGVPTFKLRNVLRHTGRRAYET
jgi:hypothetical protein